MGEGAREKRLNYFYMRSYVQELSSKIVFSTATKVKKNSKFVSKLSDIMTIKVCHNHNLRSLDGATRGEHYQCEII